MEKWRDWPWREFGLVVCLYLFFAIFYMVALPFSYGADMWSSANWRILYLDYPLKGLLTLPVWYLTFHTFRHWSLTRKILLNLAVLPLWAKAWQQGYYWLVDNYFGGGHLAGAAQWWDIYIPALFYVLQFGIFHAWQYHKDLHVAERERNEASRLALSSELAALKAQLNPHFLYNAFNTISASLDPGQERTREMIARLSDLFRYQLRANREATLPLAAELDFVTDYLTLEKARFGDRLAYRIDVAEPELALAQLPPLLVQPLVENAVRHGLSPLVDGGLVTISARPAPDNHLEVEVADNGIGFDPETVRYGYGLTNTQRRLGLLYDAPLRITSSPGNGSRFTFRIPLVYAPQSSSDRRRIARTQTPQGIPG
ncbi:sensor histidine kinase [Lewinella sp. IMCC34183]|uniref:sensor histidine kinase n=1 Tax=Lewinella sp. IMCC34183 TaxID=2248762 RepID=UPI000E21FF1E|nr:histidine kinase [Lewinella sp. IMCC34183]